MSRENARRLAERQERDQPKIAPADVEAYREMHYPGSSASRDEFVANGGVEVPGDTYVAALSHDRFHEWFGTECDDTCPHRRLLPVATVRRPWWRRLLRMP
jgi:hypothetical protein